MQNLTTVSKNQVCLCNKTNSQSFNFLNKAKTENELKQLKEEIVSLRGDLKNEENTSSRNQQRIKKKLAEHVRIRYFLIKILFVLN